MGSQQMSYCPSAVIGHASVYNVLCDPILHLSKSSACILFTRSFLRLYSIAMLNMPYSQGKTQFLPLRKGAST
jgi:hypothetical protein